MEEKDLVINIDDVIGDIDIVGVMGEVHPEDEFIMYGSLEDIGPDGYIANEHNKLEIFNRNYYISKPHYRKCDACKCEIDKVDGDVAGLYAIIGKEDGHTGGYYLCNDCSRKVAGFICELMDKKE